MDARARAQALCDAIATAYRGPRAAVELVVCGWLAGGHVLIEDLPGLGKTTLARALAAAVGGRFRRIQGVADLLPADLTGSQVWREDERRFMFVPGPLFCEVLLFDELNRAPPRTQSALLEALAEGQVTVDGESHPLPDGFCCIATENPLEQAGTFPLPDSQRDRFLLACRLGYPEPDAERALLAADGALPPPAAVLAPGEARALRAAVRAQRVAGEVRDYLLALVRATRTARGVLAGASPRAALGLQRLAQARALLAGRAFVTPDDVQALAAPALAHRLVMAEGEAAALLAELLAALPVPR